jgi:hypothetical protein
MNKYIIILAAGLSLSLTACTVETETQLKIVSESEAEQIRADEEKEKRKTNIVGVKIVEIDGCEYLEWENYSTHGYINRNITHKGNCKFCIERQTARTLKDQ